MENRVGRDGEARNWDALAMPPSAKSYYLRVLKLESQTSKRNLREMHTVCAALDHIALGRHHQAADLLMQRLKALELASCNNNWERAGYLELLETDDAPLVNKEEEFLVAKETALHAKLHSRAPGQQWPAAWTNSDAGWWQQGKSAPWKDGSKGKSKGKKGEKGKGKGKKGEFPPAPPGPPGF